MKKEKYKFVKDLKKDIKVLEARIEKTEKMNNRNKKIKNLKIAGKFMHLVAPYMLTAGLITTAFGFAGKLPFVYDDVVVNAKIEKKIDSLGNISSNKQYTDFEDDNSKLYLYDEWENKNNEYTRSVKEYDVNTNNEKEIRKYLDMDNNTLNMVIGFPNVIEQNKKTITSEELNKKNYKEAVFYTKDNNDFIIRKETFLENFFNTAYFVFGTPIIFLEISFLRSKISKFKFFESVNDIKEEYSPINVETLQKELKITKSNYERLTR